MNRTDEVAEPEDAFRTRLAAVADAALTRVDASLPISRELLPQPEETSEVLAGRIRQDLGAPNSSRSPLDA